MPTRSATKPSSYTFDGGSDLGAIMEAGWIFISDDVAGDNITDVTGNSNTIVKAGTAAISSIGGDYGDCFQAGDSGASFNPPAGWDSFTDYSIVVGVRIDDDINNSGDSEAFATLEDTGGAQDSMRLVWATSENVLGIYEDTDSGATPEIVDGILTNSTEWATIVGVVDATADICYLYVIIDGEATQVNSVTTAGVAGAAGTNNSFAIGNASSDSPWHGVIEYCYVFNDALTSSQVDALHVDPYSWASGASVNTNILVPTGPLR